MLTLFKAPERRMRPGALGESIGWEKSRLSHQLTRMATRGLVERIECDTDARGSLDRAHARRAPRAARGDARPRIRHPGPFLDVLEPDEKRVIAEVSARVSEGFDDRAERDAG